MSRELPENPNLEHLKKQAKDLLRDAQQGDAAAIERFRSLASFSTTAALQLADAQHAIARDYGFTSWPKLKEYVDSRSRQHDPARMLLDAVRASDADRTARVLESHPELKSHINVPLANYGDMQLLFAAVQRTDRMTIDV